MDKKKLLMIFNVISVLAIISIILLHNINIQRHTVQQENTEVKDDEVIPKDKESELKSKIRINDFKFPTEKTGPTEKMKLTMTEVEDSEIEEKVNEEEVETLEEDEIITVEEQDHHTSQTHTLEDSAEYQDIPTSETSDENSEDENQTGQNHREEKEDQEPVEESHQDKEKEEELRPDPTLSDKVQGNLPSGYTASTSGGSVHIFSSSVSIGIVGYGYLSIKSLDYSDISACVSGALALGASHSINNSINNAMKLRVGEVYEENGYTAKKVTTSNIVITW